MADAKFIATQCKVVIDGVDYSDHCFRIDVPDSKEQIDVSGFSSTGAKEFLPGSRDQTITIGILQDFGSTATTTAPVHTNLYNLYNASSAFVVALNPTQAGTSATNPKFGGTAQMYEYDGLNVQLNARAEITLTLRPASGGVWGWVTA